MCPELLGDLSLVPEGVPLGEGGGVGEDGVPAGPVHVLKADLLWASGLRRIAVNLLAERDDPRGGCE